MEEIIDLLKRMANMTPQFLIESSQARKIIDFYNQHQWTAGVELIAKERKEQIEKHGETIEHDVQFNTHRQLRTAAINLLCDIPGYASQPFGWSEVIWNKMANKSYEQRLVIAGALIAAEIDRIKNSEG